MMTVWLKNNRAPTMQVREYMRKTASARLKEFKGETDIGEVLRDYPRLLDTPGMVRFCLPLAYSLITIHNI